jgi:cytochrome o ubiquinol oxidase subunit 2
MNNRLKFAFFLLVLFGIVSISLVFLYHGQMSVLSPKGLVAEKQRDLILTSTLIMQFVVIPVLLMTFAIAWRYRASNKKATYKPDWDFNFLAECLWWGVPFIIVTILSVITYKACFDLDPFKPLDSKVKPLKIQVVSLQWKWLFIYPEQNIATVNYIRFPEKTPIDFELTSDAPMNSFWIPDLGGQIYSMSGMTTELHLIANDVGTYRGSTAHISGEGFAGMVFQADSTTQEDFDQWVTSVKESDLSLDRATYEQLLTPTKYVKPSFYQLKDPGLFHWIVMKYMSPEQMGENASVN